MSKESFRESVRIEVRELDGKSVDLIAVLEAAARMSDDREGYVHALTGVIGYLADAAAPPRHTAKLRRLRDALDDLDRGIVAPALKPVKFARRPGDPAFKERIKAVAVIAVEVGKAEGRFDTYGDGYREIAGIISRAGVGSKGKPVSWTMVRDWRTSLRNKEREHRLPGKPPATGVDIETAALYADADFREASYGELKGYLRAMVEHYVREE